MKWQYESGCEDCPFFILKDRIIKIYSGNIRMSEPCNKYWGCKFDDYHSIYPFEIISESREKIDIPKWCPGGELKKITIITGVLLGIKRKLFMKL